MNNEAPAVNDDAQIADSRELLNGERNSLTYQLEELGFGARGATGLDYDSNFADSSQVSAERGEAEALVGELRNALDAVEHAIEKLDLGTFGTCERCGQPITPARLEAKPAVKTCIECASKQR